MGFSLHGIFLVLIFMLKLVRGNLFFINFYKGVPFDASIDFPKIADFRRFSSSTVDAGLLESSLRSAIKHSVNLLGDNFFCLFYVKLTPRFDCYHFLKGSQSYSKFLASHVFDSFTNIGFVFIKFNYNSQGTTSSGVDLILGIQRIFTDPTATVSYILENFINLNLHDGLGIQITPFVGKALQEHFLKNFFFQFITARVDIYYFPNTRLVLSDPFFLEIYRLLDDSTYIKSNSRFFFEFYYGKQEVFPLMVSLYPVFRLSGSVVPVFEDIVNIFKFYFFSNFFFFSSGFIYSFRKESKFWPFSKVSRVGDVGFLYFSEIVPFFKEKYYSICRYYNFELLGFLFLSRFVFEFQESPYRFLNIGSKYKFLADWIISTRFVINLRWYFSCFVYWFFRCSTYIRGKTRILKR